VNQVAPAIVALTGATAVGKTEVALALADLLPVDIISMDSAMVYRGLDIGSAKPSKSLLARYPHALVDIRDPGHPYSAAEFLHDADQAVRASLAAGRIPLLVGGTMLYLKAFRDGLADLPGADPEIRADIQRQAERLGWPGLHERLSRLDPVAARGIHPNNAARIERALEVCEITGRPLSELWNAAEDRNARARHGISLKEFCVMPDSRSALHERIAARVDGMLKAGFVAEVQSLYDRGDLHPDLPAIRAVGYRQVWAYLDGDIAEAELSERIAVATRQLARRQLTWLRGWPIESMIWDDGRRLAAVIADSLRLEKS
jgi:tRNA dimethylallyltransferase